MRCAFSIFQHLEAVRNKAQHMLYSFPPIATSDATILVLGSMPGAISLQKQQYYAHPRNAFWRIVGELFHFDPQISYEQRVAAVKQANIAIWDVLQACQRDGSLDTNIEKDSMVANDFAGFFSQHTKIQRVVFNGATAETIFRRQVLPTLRDTRGMTFTRLPSTSPAHAGMTMDAKASAWRSELSRCNTHGKTL